MHSAVRHQLHDERQERGEDDNSDDVGETLPIGPLGEHVVEGPKSCDTDEYQCKRPQCSSTDAVAREVTELLRRLDRLLQEVGLREFDELAHEAWDVLEVRHTSPVPSVRVPQSVHLRSKRPTPTRYDEAVGNSEEARVSSDEATRARRNLIPIVWGQAVSLFGDYIAFFTLPYFVLALTGDAIDLGLTAAAETLPMILFGLAAGVFLDRRRRLGATLIGVDLVRAGAFVFLAIAAASGAATPVIVFGVAFVVGSMAVLFDSGLQAWMTRSLLEDDLVKANAQMGLARTITLSVGPLAGGMIVALAGGFALAFGLNAVTFVASAAMLALVRPIRSRPSVEHEPFRQAITSGVKILWADRRLRWGTIGGTITNFVFQPLEALLVLFVATEILGIDSMEQAITEEGAILGLFFALQAAVGSVGVAFAGRVARSVPLGTMYTIGLAMLGGGFFVVAVLASWWSVIPAGIAITGVTWVNVALVTLRQRLAPPEHMGRVIAASRTFAWAGLPAGAALGGLIAGWVGVVPVYLVGSAAVTCIAVGLTQTALVRDRVFSS